MFYNYYYFHRSFWNEKELSVSSGALRKKIKFCALEKQKISKVSYLAAHMHMLYLLHIVPALLLWFEMWGARGEHISMLRTFWDLG